VKPDIVIDTSQKQPDDGGIVRERDLEGHLPEEGAPRGDKSPVVVADKAKASARGSPMATSIDEVPKNPAKGNDFTLSVGYQLLAKTVAERRVAAQVR
jgi:carboxyl-terminal processing protease